MSKILRTSLIYNIGLLLIVLLAMVGTASATVRTVDPSGSGTYTTIQSAIDASIDGDTINVNSSTYYESININKRLTIRGVDTGSGNPIINYAGIPVTIQANNVTFNRFTITGALYNGIWVKSSGNRLNNNNVISSGGQGIFLDHSNDNRLINDQVTSSVFDGISMYYSNNNTLINNRLDSNNHSIKLNNSNNNTMINNTGIDNSNGGILMFYSNYNNITGNVMNGDIDGGGIGIYFCNNNTIVNNTVNDNGGNGIHVDDGSSYNTLIGNTANNNVRNGIHIDIDSSYNTLIGNTINGGGAGILITPSGGNYNTLIGNVVSGSGSHGVVIRSSSGNKLTNNHVTSVEQQGIFLDHSSNNELDNNEIILGNVEGIFAYYSDSNMFTNNILEYNDHFGIQLNNSNNNILSGNDAEHNNIGGILIYNSSNNNNLTNNVANNNNGNGIQMSESSYNTVMRNAANDNSRDGITLYSYVNNSDIRNNVANNNNGSGIYMSINGYNTVVENALDNNVNGISLHNSSTNTIANNTVRYNAKGLDISGGSTNNNIYNNYFNNTLIGNVSNSNIGTWNIAKTLGTNIIGGQYLGGNFWGKLDGTGFSQTCYDNDVDGICDTIYNLSVHNVDYLPLGGRQSQPVAEAGGPYIVDEGMSITMDANGSYDPSGSVLTYAWDWNGDGIYEVNNFSFIRTPKDGPNASRTIELQVTNGQGRVATDTAILTVNNVNPVVNAGPDQTINTGDTANFAASFSDVQPDMNASTAQINYGDGTTENVAANPNGAISGSHLYANSDTYTVTVTVTDKDGGIGSDTLALTVESSNTPPIADAGGLYTVDEGSSVTVEGSASSDPDGDTLTHEWDLNNDSIYESPGVTAVIVPSDGPTTLTVGLQVSDGKGGIGTDTATITVNNVAPIIDSLSADPYLAQVGTAITGTGTFHDPGTIDTFVAVWNWDDVTNTINLPAGSISTTDSHTYTTPGVYSTSLQVTDKDGGSDIENMSQYIVIYDPEGGFVTGGGWINSPAGAYIANQTLIGMANFGFVSKYQKGATIPIGETEFQFKIADLNFHSTSYDWLVVAGARAQYKGSGTINGAGDYAFMLTAIDGQINGGGGTDKFRIKIWEKVTETIVYDNQNGAMDDAEPVTIIVGGSIVIHK